jgi:hypothetical protein
MSRLACITAEFILDYLYVHLRKREKESMEVLIRVVLPFGKDKETLVDPLLEYK